MGRAAQAAARPDSERDAEEVGGAPADLLALRQGVHRIALPTPMVASVNCWLIVDRPLTLVDAGLNWGGSLDALELELRRIGFAVEEIDLVLVTHEHVDHIGLADAVARRAGADVACHERLAGWLAGLPGSLEADDGWTARRLAAHGAPPTVVAAFEARMEMMRMLGSRPLPSVVLREGEELRLRDRTLRVGLRPGHSPTDTVFEDRDHGLAFVGDHLMPEARTTPYLVPPERQELAGGGNAPEPFGTHDRAADIDPHGDLAPARELRASLRRTASQTPPGTLGLPGHGAAFRDVAARADEQLARRRRRALRLLDHLDAKPTSAYELARRAYPALSPARAFLGLLEVLAQLAILLDEDLVRAHPRERAAAFSLAGA